MPTHTAPTQTHPVEMLYTEHHDWLHNWLRQKLNNAAQAADLVQDTFVQVLAAPRLPELHTPRAYLVTIAKRALFDFWRRRDLEQAYLEALACLPPSHAPSEEERYAVIQALLHVDRVLDRLPRAAKQVFLLNQLQDLGYRDISDQLGIPVITVRRHMARAIRACCDAQDPDAGT